MLVNSYVTYIGGGEEIYLIVIKHVDIVNEIPLIRVEKRIS